MATNKLPGMAGRLAIVAALCLITTRVGAAPITEWHGDSPRPAGWVLVTDATYDEDGSGSGLAGGTTAESTADGSNLSLVGSEWFHQGDGMRLGWNAVNTGSTESGAGSNNGYVEYTFDQAYTITGLMVWNQGEQYYRGTQIAQFFTTTDGVNWDAQIWTDGQNDYDGARTHDGARETGTLTPTNTDIWQFTQVPSADATGDNPATDVYSGLNWENVTAVRFAPRASYNSSGVGLGAIQFVLLQDSPNTPASITYPTDSATGWFTVSWPETLWAESYRLERTSDDGTSWSEVYSGTAVQFQDQALSGTYRYRVRGENTTGAGDWRTGTQNLVVTLNALATWRVENFDEPWDEGVAGTQADANSDGYDNFTNFALRGDPLVDDGAVIEPLMVWNADLNEAVFTARVRAADGVFSAVTGGYYIPGVAYYVEVADEPNAAQWARMIMTVENTEIVEGPDGPMLQAQVSTATIGEVKGFARLIVRNTD